MGDNRALRTALTSPAADELICAALRGESPAWPRDGDQTSLAARLVERSEFHGVSTLLHHHQPSLAGWPTTVTQALHQQALRQAMWELGHEQVIRATLSALAACGVHPVLFKGTALAYSLYASPVLRERGDTDLIVPPDARQLAHDTLVTAGFAAANAVSGRFVSYQATYTRAGAGGHHPLDLHWKINNSEVLSRLFTFEELSRGAEPLPALGPHARCASRVHALLLACMHRSTHKQNPYYVGGVAQYESNRLIWLCDIDLLAARLTAAEWTDFAALAARKGLRAVCLDGMRQAASRFHTVYPQDVIASLENSGPPELPARYLDAGKLRQQWMDFRALASTADRVRLLLELVFPPRAYMHSRYEPPRYGGLPWLYVRRAVHGLAKVLARKRST